MFSSIWRGRIIRYTASDCNLTGQQVQLKKTHWLLFWQNSYWNKLRITLCAVQQVLIRKLQVRLDVIFTLFPHLESEGAGSQHPASTVSYRQRFCLHTVNTNLCKHTEMLRRTSRNRRAQYSAELLYTSSFSVRRSSEGNQRFTSEEEVKEWS